MQLKDLKSKVDTSIKEISETVHQKKKSSVLWTILIILASILLILVLIFAFNISGLLTGIHLDKPEGKSNMVLKLAETNFRNGYLDNSAIYYQVYIDANPSKVNKVIAYKRLFEISVIKKDYDKALSHLDNIEGIDPDLPEIYIGRLKIYLRQEQYSRAKKEILRAQSKIRRSVELTDIIGTFYLKTGDPKKALDELQKISFRKREYDVHKKIMLSMISLNKLDDSLKYIQKIERKINLLGDNRTRSELLILKGITKLLKGTAAGLSDDLSRADTLSTYYNDLTAKLLIIGYIIQDEAALVTEAVDKAGENYDFDIDFLKALGDYFTYKNDNKNALWFYEKIKEKRDFTREETLAMSDLYHMTGDHENSIKMLEELSKKYGFRTPGLFKNLSINYEKLGDHNKAVFFLKEGIIEFPDDTDFYIRLAKFYIDRKDPENAGEYIERAREIISSGASGQHDKRIDILNIAAHELENKNITEKELLELREKGSDNPEYYFSLIKFYIRKNKYLEAQRELDTVSNMPLDKDQKESFLTYTMITALNNADIKLFKGAKNSLVEMKSSNIGTRIDIAIIHILDHDPDSAIRIFEEIDTADASKEIRDRIYFLQAVCYFHKSEYQVALKLVRKVLENEPTDQRASYLQSLIYKYYGESR